VEVVELDLTRWSELADPPLGGSPAYAVVTVGDDLVGACFVPAVRTEAELAACLAEELGDAVRARVVAAAVGRCTAWARPSRPPRPPVSVVVCTSDRPEHLARCLRSLQTQLGPDDEMVVVDNSPDRNAHPTARSMGARWVAEPRPGSSWARNRGIAESRHDLIVFVDDDCVVDRSCLDAVAEPFADPAVGAVTGNVLANQAGLRIPASYDRLYPYHRGWRPVRFEGTTGTWQSPHDCWRLGTGALMAWRRDVLDRIDAFDTALGAGTRAGARDDLDAFRRALALGTVFVYQPFAVVWHDHPETMRGVRRTLLLHAKGNGAEVAKIVLEERRRRFALRVLAAEWRWQLRSARHHLGNLIVGQPRLPVSGVAAQPLEAVLGAASFVRWRGPLRRGDPRARGQRRGAPGAASVWPKAEAELTTGVVDDPGEPLHRPLILRLWGRPVGSVQVGGSELDRRRLAAEVVAAARDLSAALVSPLDTTEAVAAALRGAEVPPHPLTPPCRQPASGTVEVVVCTNRPADALETLLTELEGHLPASVWENGTEVPRLGPLCRRTGAAHHHDPAPGLAAARNRAIAASTAEWVLFLDDDCVLGPTGAAGLAGASAERSPMPRAWGP
jgi:glycosyltransferase involved in cell wall biosynthesis